jgi:hypothetical protein
MPVERCAAKDGRHAVPNKYEFGYASQFHLKDKPTKDMVVSVLRKHKEIANIIPVDAVEAYSVVISDQLCTSLWDFLQSKGLRGCVIENVIGADTPHHDIQIRKTISFEALNLLVNDWKHAYVNS